MYYVLLLLTVAITSICNWRHLKPGAQARSTPTYFSHSNHIAKNEDNEKMKPQTDLTMSVMGNNSMFTPLMSKKIWADPRSATVGITRTPIEIVPKSPPLTKKVVSAIPKYLRMQPYLETNMDIILPAMTPVRRILDPRSPNIIQERTPILIKETTEYLSPIVIINKGPDMMSPKELDPRSPSTNFDRTPILKSKLTEQQDFPSYDSRTGKFNIEMSYCETTGNFDIPEIQTLSKISTSIMTPRNLEERMKFCNKEDSKENVHEAPEEDVYFENSEESEAEDQITVIQNPRIMDSCEEAHLHEKISKLPEEIYEKKSIVLEDSLNCAMTSKIQDEENNGKIQIWRDSSSSFTNVAPRNCTSGKVLKHSKAIMIECDSIILEVSKNDDSKSNAKAECKSKAPLINKSIKKKKIMKQEVKGIFDDITIETDKCRTPLANRSNNNKIDIPSKSPQQILKTKNLSVKPDQQENTPPNSKRYRSKTRANRTHWDANMSVII